MLEFGTLVCACQVKDIVDLVVAELNSGCFSGCHVWMRSFTESPWITRSSMQIRGPEDSPDLLLRKVGRVLYGKYQGDGDGELLGKISLARHAENAGLISDSDEKNSRKRRINLLSGTRLNLCCISCIFAHRDLHIRIVRLTHFKLLIHIP